jgi:hypothetical protein
MVNDFLKTKPVGLESIATPKGWVDAESGELLVSIRDLDKKLGDAIPAPIKRGPGRPRGSKAKPKQDKNE